MTTLTNDGDACVVGQGGQKQNKRNCKRKKALIFSVRAIRILKLQLNIYAQDANIYIKENQTKTLEFFNKIFRF